MDTDLVAMVMIIIGLIGVLLAALALGSLYGGEWSNLASETTSVIIGLGVFAFIIGSIAYWRKRW